jgi:hypothetical protein
MQAANINSRPDAMDTRMSVIFVSPHRAKPCDMRREVTDQLAPQHPPVLVPVPWSTLMTAGASILCAATLASCVLDEDPQQQPSCDLTGVAVSGMIFDCILVFSMKKSLLQV